MIFVTQEIKTDPVQRWNLPDKIFFAAGACHILAYAFLEKYSKKELKSFWIKPKTGHRGNHIFVTDGSIVFDYEGFSTKDDYLEKLGRKMKSFFYKWDYELIELPKHVLVSEKDSKKIDGLWLREPEQFLHNALPRAHNYLGQFETIESFKQDV